MGNRINPINNFFSRTLGAISKAKPMKKLVKSFQDDPAKALTVTTVGSIVVKDGVGCYKYVTQSMKNEEIPEKQRKFVASLDLTNGILMIATQIAMVFLMRKISEPMFNKLFSKSFNPKAKRDMLTRLRMEADKIGAKIPRKIEAEKAYEKVRSDALDLFKFVIDVGVATIIGKRIITPFIATPLAGVVQDKLFPEHKDDDVSEIENDDHDDDIEIDDDDD